MAQSRKRIQFKFWLDIVKDDEYMLAEEVMLLKNKRGFSRTIRDGLRLILDLRAGQVAVLFELFPWVKEKLEPPANTAPTTALERQLERLEAVLKEQGGIPIDQPTAAPTGLTSLSAVKLSLPSLDDDDEDTIVLNKSTNNSVMGNFFASLAKL